MAMPWAANCSMVSGCRPVACSMQSVPAAAKSRSDSSPKQWAVVRAPSSCAACTAAITVSRGNDGDRSPVSRSIQSPTSLTQPSPRRASCAHVGDDVLGLDLVGEVADVAAGPGDVPARPDDARQVLPLVDPARVGRAAGVADEQGAGVAVGAGLLLLGGAVDGAVLVQADVAVRVDEAGQHPARDGLHVAGASGAVNEIRPSTTQTSGRTSSGPTSTGPVRWSASVMTETYVTRVSRVDPDRHPELPVDPDLPVEPYRAPAPAARRARARARRRHGRHGGAALGRGGRPPVGGLAGGDVPRQRGRRVRPRGRCSKGSPAGDPTGVAAADPAPGGDGVPRGVHDVQLARGRDGPPRRATLRPGLGLLYAVGSVVAGVPRLRDGHLGGVRARPTGPVVTPLVVLGVVVAGGLGAVARFVVDAVVRGRTSGAYPVGTALINVTGSFVLGLVTGLVLAARGAGGAAQRRGDGVPRRLHDVQHGELRDGAAGGAGPGTGGGRLRPRHPRRRRWASPPWASGSASRPDASSAWRNPAGTRSDTHSDTR